MKKLFFLSLSLLFALSALAQIDRSTKPEPGPAPDLDFGDYKVYELKNGLKVIVVEDHKLPQLSMRLLVDRDPVQEGDKAGYVSLAGEMLRQGTTNRTKDQLDEEIDFIGADLFTSSNLIYTSGLSKYTDKLFEVMADVTLNPSFPEAEFDKLKKQQISGLESEKDDPEAVASKVYDALLYGKDHPYGEITSIESVERVELEDVKTYYNNYWTPNQTYLAIVGDIKPREAKKLAKKHFGEWEEGNIVRNHYETPERPESPQVAFVDKQSAVQSVINLGNTIDLKPGDPEIVRLRLANQILGGGSLGRLFQNIREDKGYTYGAYSSFDDDRLVGEFSASASVRNEVTDSAITEFLYEFNRLRTDPVPEDELKGAKNYIIGSFGRSLESAQTRGSYALNIERYDLPKDYYQDYLKRLGDISAEQVTETAQKYITPDQVLITVVGKGSDVAEKLKKFGELNYYDEDGNVTDPPMKDIPEGVTANQVVNDYIKAIGGKENLQKLKDITMKYDAEVAGAGMSLEAIEVRKRPDKYKFELKIEGRGTVMKQVYDGEKGRTSGMQGNKELEGEELESLENAAQFIPELNYLSEDYELELTEMAKIDGEQAYVLKVTDKNGKVITEYYSAESGLKLKQEQTEETPQGPMSSSQSFADYREVNGVLLPHEVTSVTGPQRVKMTATDVQVNSGVEDEAFE